MYLCICLFGYLCILYISICVHVLVFQCICLCACVYLCTCLFVYLCIVYISICVYVYLCVCKEMQLKHGGAGIYVRITRQRNFTWLNHHQCNCVFGLHPTSTLLNHPSASSEHTVALVIILLWNCMRLMRLWLSLVLRWCSRGVTWPNAVGHLYTLMRVTLFFSACFNAM